MRTFVLIAAAIAYGLLATGCAGGFATLYSLEGKRTIECTISAGGLGQIVHWSSTYEGRPAAAEAKK